MTFNVEFPDYRDKSYLVGNYAGFKYHTELGVKSMKVCFLSSQDRNCVGASKFEAENRSATDPNMGPGKYTPLPPSVRKRKKEPSALHKDQVIESSSESQLTGSEYEESKYTSGKEKETKVLRKSGLLWGRRYEERVAMTPGPADTPVVRYPESLKIVTNKVPFNSTTTVIKYPTSIIAIAPKSSADVYKHADLFKSSFESKKEFDIPVIICVKPIRDICCKCKKEIDENYFYILNKLFACRNCYKETMEGHKEIEKVKLSHFKPGRYCTSCHLHHKLKGYDKLLPYNQLYKLLLRESYHSQYTGGRFIGEGIPTKEDRKSSGERSKIYDSLLPESAFQTQDKDMFSPNQYDNEAFERTVGSRRVFEEWTGSRKECTPCNTAPVFFFSRNVSLGQTPLMT